MVPASGRAGQDPSAFFDDDGGLRAAGEGQREERTERDLRTAGEGRANRLVIGSEDGTGTGLVRCVTVCAAAQQGVLKARVCKPGSRLT